jgi:hypothetical protein
MTRRKENEKEDRKKNIQGTDDLKKMACILFSD